MRIITGEKLRKLEISKKIPILPALRPETYSIKDGVVDMEEGNRSDSEGDYNEEESEDDIFVDEEHPGPSFEIKEEYIPDPSSGIKKEEREFDYSGQNTLWLTRICASSSSS
ncbi:hypothetical protein Ddc_17522 [Ditylenchus destructor]|nr:hypothetical protein Ddc_17522 [Ditylenchus destructor]